MLCVKLKKLSCSFLPLKTLEMRDIPPPSPAATASSYMDDAAYKRVKENDCMWKMVFLALCGEGSNPLDDSLCLSLCRQEESAGDWKNSVERGGKRQKQADGGRVFSPNSRVFSVQYDCAIQSWLTRSRPFVPRQPLVSSILQCGWERLQTSSLWAISCWEDLLYFSCTV